MTDVQSDSSETSDDFPVHTVSSKIVYKNPWITIHEDETVARDGTKGTYGYMESRDSVTVVVVNDEGEIYMVHGFRYPTKSYGWELPGGGSDGEDMLTASKRELEEETGIVAETWKRLGEAVVCDGLMTEKMAVYLARTLSFDGKKETSQEVFQDMRFFTAAEIDNMILSGEINDCQTLAGLQYYAIWKRKQ